MCPKIIQLAKASIQSSIIPSISYGIFELGRNYETIKNTIKEKYINKNYNQTKFPLLK
jgi:hypothetical protein